MNRNYIKRIIIVDVEADGNIIGDHSMVCFGACLAHNPSISFYGKVKPISNEYNPEALSISGFSREEHLEFDDPKEVMLAFVDWINKNVPNNPVLFSDNNQFDGSWINYYLLKFAKTNPFGWSSRRIGDLFSGASKTLRKPWKGLRVSEHTHNPVEDAQGNAEALLRILVGYEITKLKESDIIIIDGLEYSISLINNLMKHIKLKDSSNSTLTINLDYILDSKNKVKIILN